MTIKVKVKTNSRKNEIIEVSENYFEVKVSVPPEKGKANERVIELLSKHYKISKSRINIIKGETSKEKLIELN
ncbi:MAG TPA: DUF167 domain-containing protein [Ignavibacteria bacterium]|jgi:hypothetical protein